MRFLGDEGDDWERDWDFFLAAAAASAPDMRASKAEGGFDMARRGTAEERERGKERREETLTVRERWKGRGKQGRKCNASMND